MKIIGIYSFKNGREIIENKFGHELGEIKETITAVDDLFCKTRNSQIQGAPERAFYKSGSFNQAFKREFKLRKWQTHKVMMNYSSEFYVSDYMKPDTARETYRKIDFLKNRVGVEVQFGKYPSSIVCNTCAKMTIFHNHGLIDVGVEIVPIKELANEMSTGVSYFEQFVWDLENRGVADIDIPVLILGVTVQHET
jgi:hypothetical protein